MKVLLDEDLPHKLRTSLTDHEVSTTAYRGWSGQKMVNLLSAAEAAGFEVLVTGDQNLSYEHNLRERRISVVTLTAQEWPILIEHLAEIRAAVDRAYHEPFQIVDCSTKR